MFIITKWIIIKKKYFRQYQTFVIIKVYWFWIQYRYSRDSKEKFEVKPKLYLLVTYIN